MTAAAPEAIAHQLCTSEEVVRTMYIFKPNAAASAALNAPQPLAKCTKFRVNAEIKHANIFELYRLGIDLNGCLAKPSGRRLRSSTPNGALIKQHWWENYLRFVIILAGPSSSGRTLPGTNKGNEDLLLGSFKAGTGNTIAPTAFLFRGFGPMM